jgi:hypothetical protein
MAVTSYTTLKDAISAWAHRTDISTVVDDFIDLCEARLNRELRVSQQEEIATSTPTSEYLDLPTDCIAVRNIQINTNPVRELEYITPAEMARLAADQTVAGKYTIVSDRIKLDASTSYTIEISYYAKIPALTSVQTNNWVLDSHPEAYLYGSLAEAFKYAMDDEQAAKYASMFNEVLTAIKRLDSRRKHANSLRVRAA